MSRSAGGTIDALFDGEVFRPQERPDLEANTRVRITVEPLTPPSAAPKSFLDTALSLDLEGPADWSSRVDDYLYGPADPQA